MFGKRKDGKILKNLDVFQKIMPHIMTTRNDALNWCVHEQRVEALDKFIENEKNEGRIYNYMHIVIASVVRLFALRPNLNRFVMNGRIYQRNNIQVSITIKKLLKDDGPASTLKMTFGGTETLEEVKQIIDRDIANAVKLDEANSTEKTAKMFEKLPNWIYKLAVGTLKWLDKGGHMPKKVLDASPFHTSLYLTNMKSLKIDYIHHHIYNFGTCGVFISMGKEKLQPVVEDEKLAIGKIMKMGIMMDERFCDGFYFARSLRYWNDVLNDPSILKQAFTPDQIICK